MQPPLSSVAVAVMHRKWPGPSSCRPSEQTHQQGGCLGRRQGAIGRSDGLELDQDPPRRATRAKLAHRGAQRLVVGDCLGLRESR